MADAIIAGVDPGIIHTGLVVFEFSENFRRLDTSFDVINGTNAPATRAALVRLVHPSRLGMTEVFIEKYRPRSGFGTNDQMMEANATFPAELGGTLLLNMGVKRVVTRDLLDLLGVWSFSTTTHHQDLRSAARIAVLGMLRDHYLNRGLYTYVTHRLDTP